MNKVELVAKIAEKTGETRKNTEKMLRAFEESISESLVAGEKVSLIGFGTFEVRERAAREGRNPHTGEIMTIAASKVPSFKAGKALKDMVNN